ncbi:hypothetical protein Tco_0870812 [Tanacetum coccineum]
MKIQRPIRRIQSYLYAVFKIKKQNILEDIERGPYSKKPPIRHIQVTRYTVVSFENDDLKLMSGLNTHSDRNDVGSSNPNPFSSGENRETNRMNKVVAAGFDGLYSQDVAKGGGSGDLQQGALNNSYSQSVPVKVAGTVMWTLNSQPIMGKKSFPFASVMGHKPDHKSAFDSEYVVSNLIEEDEFKTRKPRSWGRSSYARALIEVSAEKAFMESIVIAIPLGKDKGTLWPTVRFENEESFSANDMVEKDTAAEGFEVVKKKRNKKKKHQKQVDGVVFDKPSLTLHYRRVDRVNSTKQSGSYVASTSKVSGKSTSTSAHSQNVQLENSFSALNDDEENEWKDTTTWQHTQQVLDVLNESDSDVDEVITLDDRGCNLKTI